MRPTRWTRPAFLRALARRPGAALVLSAGCLAATLLWTAQTAHAQAQPNFKPLERGEVTEVEQKLLVIRGIEVGGDYAFRLRENKDKDMAFLNQGTALDQDFRLRLNTVFNEDVSMKLTLQTATTAMDSTNLRSQPVDNRGREANGQTLQINAREAYLQYRFNPNSAINLGQFELELGDKRGKVYRAIASGMGFDCRVGTWCMPFGATRVGAGAADWIYHWALRYNAFDEPTENGRRLFSVEVFRIIYTESNVPLGNNLGPATYNTANPKVATRVQMTDDCTAACGDPGGNPIFYDATGFNYFGLRLDWQPSSFFLSFDFTNGQGSRGYHRLADSTTGLVPGLVRGPGNIGADYDLIHEFF